MPISHYARPMLASHAARSIAACAMLPERSIILVDRANPIDLRSKLCRLAMERHIAHARQRNHDLATGLEIDVANPRSGDRGIGGVKIAQVDIARARIAHRHG